MMELVQRTRLLLAALLLTVAAPTYAQQAGGVRVQALLTGRAPRMPLLQKKSNDPACVVTNRWATEEEVVVHPSGGIRNVVVFVSRNAPNRPPQDAELTHTTCMYRPRVVAVSAAGTLTINNADQTTHNVHVYEGVKTVANHLQHAGGAPLTFKWADHAGRFLRIRCDHHPWEVAFAYVVPTNVFGVTGETGEVHLELPQGSYTLTAWHERYGAKTQEVTVGADGKADVKFLYDGNEPRP